MNTLSLSSQSRQKRLNAAPKPRIGSRTIRASQTTDSLVEVVTDVHSGITALRCEFQQGDLPKPGVRRNVEAELAVFQKIMAAEAGLAEVREVLKQATDICDQRTMSWAIKEVAQLEARLCRLRGIRSPHTKPRSGKVARRRKDGIAMYVEGVVVNFRTWDQIAQDKLEDMRQDANQELRERADYIATLQGFREGSVGHVHASAEAHTAIVMIERLQAFEATQAQYADEVGQSERIAHFGQESDDY